jgi:hypothetical protein
MNVIPMMSEVLSITNPMIRETALPNFRLAPDQGAERMGIPSFDQLEGARSTDLRDGSGKES